MKVIFKLAGAKRTPAHLSDTFLLDPKCFLGTNKKADIFYLSGIQYCRNHVTLKLTP